MSGPQEKRAGTASACHREWGRGGSRNQARGAQGAGQTGQEGQRAGSRNREGPTTCKREAPGTCDVGGEDRHQGRTGNELPDRIRTPAPERLPQKGHIRAVYTHTHTHRNSQTRTRISTGTQRLTQALADRHALAHRDTRTDTRRHTRCSSTAPQHCPACSSARAWLPGYKERG